MTRDRTDELLDILLVEDNPGDVRLIQEGVSEIDSECSLRTVVDGEEALDYLSQTRGDGSPREPDLILLDLNLPKINGRTVLKESSTSAEYPDVPVCILTSSNTQNDILETYDLGASGYFSKPTNPNEFISLIQTIGEAVATSGRPPAGEYSEIE